MELEFYREENFKDTEIGRIPEEWKVVKLGDVVEIYDSKRIPLSNQERAKRKGPYPYCGATGIIDYIDDYIFDGEYVLLAEDGGYYGHFEPSAYIMSGKFWVNNHAHIFRAITGISNNWFLMYVLNYMDLKPYIVGSTRTKLNQEYMRKIAIILPPLHEQQKIAHVLKSLDESIQTIEDSISRLERLKKGLMQELLTKGIGHNNFKDTEIGRIPEEWEVVRLKEIGDVITGKTPSTSVDKFWNGNIPFITPGDINETKYVYKTQRYVTDDGARQVGKIPKDTVLVVCIGSTIGKTALAYTDSITNQQINSIICKKNIANPHYIYYIMSFKSNLLKSHSGIAAVPIIKKSLFKQLKIPLPPLPEQQKIAEILSTFDELIQTKREKKARMEKIKKAVMNKLLTGEIRIKT